jgi:hypothetical protein
MWHPWKKLCNIKCLSPLRDVEDPRSQYESFYIGLSCVRVLSRYGTEEAAVTLPSIQRKLAAIFSADVQGYSRLKL